MITPPLLPFARPLIDEATIARVVEVIRSNWIASGPNVVAFEQALSGWCGGRPVRSMTSATVAMEVALQLCGIGAGDEVITPSQTFFAAANMITKVGAKPVFVDCDLLTRNLDLAQVEAAITPATRAILPTHFLAPLDGPSLYALAQRHGLRVIEDAALAIGSRYPDGTAVGARGDLIAFSFHPNKNITTIEGGALVVNDAAEAARVETLRFHGIARLPDGTRDVDVAGGKYNLSDVSAAIGLAQMAQLEGFVAHRRALAKEYLRLWNAQPACVLPPDVPGHSWNMFAVLLPLDRLTISRKTFVELMQAQGIGVGISYEACHLATLYRKLGYRKGQFPVTERIARETVCLPLHAAMTLPDVARVCSGVSAILAGHGK
ncbi:MAG: DegT/DnrJ/EryC1/StrS aminotransferase family protein [Betaproteobacteria bacterium]